MLNKDELVELIESLEIASNEGISSDINKNVYPRIIYWDYAWESQVASSEEYDTLVTYQISFMSKIPRHPKLVELKHLLNQKNIFPIIQHEYISEDKCWHSYFAIEVLENV